MTDAELPVRPLPHCPHPVRVRGDGDRWSGPHVVEVCGCPHDDSDRWRVHWMMRDGRQMFCPCGLRQRAHDPGAVDDPATYYVTTNGGYACPDCARRVPGFAVGRPVVQDMACCYCDRVAEKGRGVVLEAFHPALITTPTPPTPEES